MLGTTRHTSRSSVLHVHPALRWPLVYTSSIAALIALTFGTPQVSNKLGYDRAVHSCTKHADASPKFNRTRWNLTQRTPLRTAFTDSTVKTIFVTIRQCSGSAGNSKNGISRSKSVTLPVTRKDLFAQAGSGLETPAVVVSSPPGEITELRRCEAFVCLFYAQDPVKHARCHDFCTIRELNPLSQLKRHLRGHKGDVSEDILERAINCLKIRSTDHDNRRRRQEGKVPLHEKLAAVYRKCREVLFGVNVDVPIKLCPLPDTHIKRRRRSSNRTTDGSVDRGRLSITRPQTARASSQTSSALTLEARHTLIDFTTSFHTLNNDANYQSRCRERIENISLRLARCAENIPTDQGAFDGLSFMLDVFEDRLEDWDRHVGTDNGPPGMSQAMQEPFNNQVSDVAGDANQFMLPNLPQSVSDFRQMFGETDIDLNIDDGQFETFQGQMWNAESSLQDRQDTTTWQQRTFGIQNWPTHARVDVSRRSYTPEPSGEGLRRAHLAAPSPTSMATMTTTFGEPNSASFHRSNVSANIPWDSMSSQECLCGFCGLHMSVCNCNNRSWI